MTKKLIFTFTLSLLLSQYEKSFSVNTFVDYKILVNKEITKQYIFPEFIHWSNDHSAHFDISATNSYIDITTLQVDIGYGGDTGSETSIFSFVKSHYYPIEGKIEIYEKGIGNPFVGNLIYDASSVMYDNKKIYLEQAYFDGILDDPSFYKRLVLVNCFISDNKEWIGGIVQWSEYRYHPSLDNYIINIWDVNNGELLFQEIPYWGGVYPTIELCFLLKDRYFLVRIIRGEKNYKDFPKAHLLDMNTFEFIPANRDLALTSNEKYYVTERDGLPSLVETATHEVIQRYDPGSPMTACCFSPDDRTLYIACEDLQIYAFDSHLPSDTQAWKLYE